MKRLLTKVDTKLRTTKKGFVATTLIAKEHHTTPRPGEGRLSQLGESHRHRRRDKQTAE